MSPRTSPIHVDTPGERLKAAEVTLDSLDCRMDRVEQKIDALGGRIAQAVTWPTLISLGALIVSFIHGH